MNLTDEVMVTTADSAALSAARVALRHLLHENHRRLLLENLSTATGIGPSGDETTVRLGGNGTEVPAPADAPGSRTTFVGSFPWFTDDEIPPAAHSAAGVIAG